MWDIFLKIVEPSVMPLIGLLAIANIALIAFLSKIFRRTQAVVNGQTDRLAGLNSLEPLSNKEKSELKNNSEKATMLFNFYSNITASFPMLGIFGTVVSLMHIGTTSTEMISGLKYAMETTVAGILAAVVFKLVESWLSSKLEYMLNCEEKIVFQDHDNEESGR